MQLPADPETLIEEDLPMVKDGETKLHEHPEATFLTHAIAQFYTTPPKKRSMTWREFLILVEDELEHDLPVDPRDNDDLQYVQDWCRRYVAASWGILPRDVKHDLIEVQDELNSALQHHELYEGIVDDIQVSKERERKIMALLDDLKDIEEEDEANDLISKVKSLMSFTMNASARSKAAKRASNIVKNRDEELQRWGVVPPKDESGPQVNVRADNIDVSVSNNRQHLATGGRTMDVDGGVEDE